MAAWKAASIQEAAALPPDLAPAGAAAIRAAEKSEDSVRSYMRHPS